MTDNIEKAYQQGRMQGWKDDKELLKNLKEELKEKFYQRGYSEGGLAFKIIDKTFKKHLGEME